GPQHTLYIPAPLLKSGLNHISVFELHSPKDGIQFTDTPDLAFMTIAGKRLKTYDHFPAIAGHQKN
ncbi:unnamed protein product, partial [Medioppia subpectinata]